MKTGTNERQNSDLKFAACLFLNSVLIGKSLVAESGIENCIDAVLQLRVVAHPIQVFVRDTGFDQPLRRGRFVRQRIPIAMRRDERQSLIAADCLFIKGVHSTLV